MTEEKVNQTDNKPFIEQSHPFDEWLCSFSYDSIPQLHKSRSYYRAIGYYRGLPPPKRLGSHKR